MALEKNKFSEIPSDAIILSEKEAESYHRKLLRNWKDSSDVFAYTYGILFLGNASLLSSMYIHNHFRRKFKLFENGRIMSYLPMMGIPASLSCIVHDLIVLKDVTLLKQDQCPVCIEVRAATLQAVTGCIVPLIMSPILSLSLVHRYGTMNVPHLIYEPLKVAKFVIEKVQPIKNILYAIFIGNALIGSAVTYFEADSVHRVNMKMFKIYEEYSQFDINETKNMSSTKR